MHKIDATSYELGAIRLTVRRDLSFRRQPHGTEACYVIEDSAGSKFFRIGEPEYTFLSLLDGQTSIADAVAETATRVGQGAFTETQAAGFCRWLVENSLASTVQSAAAERLSEAADHNSAKRRKEWLNPLMLKMPLGCPQRWLQTATHAFGWCFGSVGFGIWLLVLLFGGYGLWADFDNFASSTSSLLAPDNWLWLGITWLALKLAHETAHGVACCRFGGETREAGVLLLLFVPLPYVDVTSSWRFGSRWQRIIVSSAGMYVEFFIAAVAAIVWTWTDSAVLQFHACNVIVTAGFVTLLFNINPLMRFDGYYIVSDLLDLPNLATHGQQDVMSLARRWLLGLQETPPEKPDGRATIVRMYGLASLIWKTMILVSLTLAAAALYHGAGIVLAAIATMLWLVMPAIRFARYLLQSDPINPPNRLRFAGIMASLLFVIGGIWNFVPYVDRMQLPATVDYDPVMSVRTAASGFVQNVHVQTGQRVEAGELLLTLHNEELAARVRELELAAEASRLDATSFHRQGKLAAFQVELENEAAILSRLEELQQQVAALTVTAPQSGTILSRDLEDFAGQWVTAGSELVVLGNDAERSVRFVAAQSDIKAVRSALNQSVKVHIWGSGNCDVDGVVTGVDPRGTTSLRYPSLSALAGGPLAVRKATTTSDSTNEQWELLEPHFTGRVALDEASLSSIGTGQTGVVEFITNRGSIGRVVTAWAEGWLRAE